MYNKNYKPRKNAFQNATQGSYRIRPKLSFYTTYKQHTIGGSAQ